MNQRFIAITIIAALAVVATIAMAQGVMHRHGAGVAQPGMRTPMGAGPMQMGGMWNRIVKELNLTQAQQTQINQIRQEFMTETQSDRDEIRTKMRQMAQLWATDNPDPAAVKAVARDIHAIKGRMIDPGVDSLIAGWNVLTPQQKAKARTMIQQHMSRHRMGMGMP